MRVRVSAPARLHLGDIDPFALGRFGYAPIVAVDKPRTIIEVSPSDSLEVSGEHIKEASIFAERVIKTCGLPGAMVKVLSSPPRHEGFGSTTSLALSIGRGIAEAYNLDLPLPELMRALGRTSTGGLYTFDLGGFVVAGGLKGVKGGKRIFDVSRTEALIPPLIHRSPLPGDWIFVVVRLLQRSKEVYGEVESKSFERLSSLEPPKHLVHEGYYLIASKLIPAVIEGDAEAFGEALTRIQMVAGRIYEPVQGSIFNPASEWIIPIIKGQKPLGYGQSSWGPTLYAFVKGLDRAETVAEGIQEEVKGRAEVFITEPDNRGARVTPL